jgi:hypothetical protein
MSLLASSFDQSKYLRAEDLKEAKILRIKSVTAELINDRTGQKKKLVLWFTSIEKGLVLNKTNNRTIRKDYGDDTAGWVGKLVKVFPTQAEFGGRMVAALRVQMPPKRASGNGQTAETQPGPAQSKPPERFGDAPPTRPEPESDRDDFDDEIPW